MLVLLLVGVVLLAASDLPTMPLGGERLMEAMRLRVELATERDTCAHRYRKMKSNSQWYKKAAQEADIDLDTENE